MNYVQFVSMWSRPYAKLSNNHDSILSYTHTRQAHMYPRMYNMHMVTFLTLSLMMSSFSSSMTQTCLLIIASINSFTSPRHTSHIFWLKLCTSSSFLFFQEPKSKCHHHSWNINKSYSLVWMCSLEPSCGVPFLEVHQAYPLVFGQEMTFSPKRSRK